MRSSVASFRRRNSNTLLAAAVHSRPLPTTLSSASVSSSVSSSSAGLPIPACIGIDEAGRGAVLGPLVVAGVAIATDGAPGTGTEHSKQRLDRHTEELLQALTTPQGELRDSKRFTTRTARERACRLVYNAAIAWRIAIVPASVVDSAVFAKRDSLSTFSGEESSSSAGSQPAGLNALELRVSQCLAAALSRDVAATEGRYALKRLQLDAVDIKADWWGRFFQDAMAKGASVQSAEFAPELALVGEERGRRPGFEFELGVCLPAIADVTAFPKLGGVVAVDSVHQADSSYLSVAAASILAKCARDRLMESEYRLWLASLPIDVARQFNEEALAGGAGSGYPSDPKTRGLLEKLHTGGIRMPPFVRNSWNTLAKLRDC